MTIKAENVLNFQRDRALKFHGGCDNHTIMLTIVTNRFTISLGRELANQCELVSDLYNCCKGIIFRHFFYPFILFNSHPLHHTIYCVSIACFHAKSFSLLCHNHIV